MKKYLIIICILNVFICSAQWSITRKYVNSQYQEISNPNCGFDTRYQIMIQVNQNDIINATTFRFDVTDHLGGRNKNWGPKTVNFNNGLFTYANSANGLYFGTLSLGTINERPPFINVKYTFKDINDNIVLVCTKKTYTCETDYDLDGIPNNIDNCIYTLNTNQANLDGDSFGDVCDEDIDNDGRNNSSDNCPLVYNPNQSDLDADGIGDVCDPVQGKPDLTMSKNNVFVFSQCTSCSSNLENLGSGRHILAKEAGILNISQIVIDNIGNAPSSSSNLKFYLSTDQTFSSDDYYFNSKDTNFTTIQSGGYKVSQSTIFGSDIPYDKPLGNYNILVIVDKNNSINESNENNNMIFIPINYRQSNFRTSDIVDELNIKKKGFYYVEFFNIRGEKIIKKGFNSFEEESVFIEQLKKEIYLLKYDNGSTRKVFVQ